MMIRCSIALRRSIRHLALVSASLIWVAVSGVPMAGAESIQEDQVVMRGVALSVPEMLVDAKRTAAQEDRLALLLGAGLLAASDENVYHSPRDLEQGDSFWGRWLYLRIDKRLREVDQWLTTVTAEQARYAEHENADMDRLRVSSWYFRRLNRLFDLELDLDLSTRDYVATKITGESYRRDYAYWRYAAEARLVWDLPHGHRVKAGYESIWKNYRETPEMESIDWQSGTVVLRYRYRFGPYHYLQLWYSRGTRNYEEEPAGLVDGTELPGNPAEEHVYSEAVARYSWPVSGRVDMQATYSYRLKEDTFADYESHASHELDALLRLRPRANLELSLEAERTTRRYEHILDESGNALRYSVVALRLDGALRIGGPLWLSASTAYTDRETNNSAGLTYRDFRELVGAVGVGLFL